VIRVLLVDDQELVRTGLRGILRPQFGFDVVGECADGRAVTAAVDTLAPDVVVMDVRMPAVDGVQATAELRRRDASPPVLALTTFDDEEVLAGMLRAGASGFVLKGVPAEDLQRAVRVVAAVRVARPRGHRPGAGDLPVSHAASREIHQGRGPRHPHQPGA
jgi:DNA-binding NarL/FixJ family response regulator